MKIVSTISIGVFAVVCLGSFTPALADPAVAGTTTVGTPPAGMSQVVFFRPSAMGMAVSCNVRENGKMIGTTNNGRYFVLTTTPGVHEYTTRGEKTDEIHVQTEADETTYVKCKIAMGIMAGRPNLSPSTKEEFETRVAHMKPSDPEKMAHAIAEDDAHHSAAGAAQ